MVYFKNTSDEYLYGYDDCPSFDHGINNKSIEFQINVPIADTILYHIYSL